MIDSLFGVLEAGLKLWDHKDAESYSQKLVSLKERWYGEFNKTPDIRDDSVLDNVFAELRILADGFAARIREQNAQN